MSASFGAGIGRMRLTCGTACGLFMLAGLETGATQGSDRAGKAANYALVQQLAAEFQRRKGSLVCAELLNLRKQDLQNLSAMPEERTPQYYAKRPCARMVEDAARLWVEHLKAREEGRNL